MSHSNGTITRKFRGTNPANNSRAPTSRPTSRAMADWFADKLSHLSIKEVAAIAECNERTAENLRAGKNAPNSATMTAIFINSPEIGALYVEHIGLLKPGEAEMAAAYTRFANAAVRGKP